MSTNFFRGIQAVQQTADWTINIKQQDNGIMTVSVMLHSDKVGDKAAQTVPPMLFKGTAEELDKGFFEVMRTPAQQTVALFANMEQYQKQLEAVKLQSQMEKDKANKDQKEKEERKKKYEAAMKKVVAFEEEKKYQHALAAMPKEEQFPEQVELIRTKRDELCKLNGQLTLEID